MHPESTVEQIAERVERLLVRYEELQRTNALLAGQVQTLTQERDSLRSRLARASNWSICSGEGISRKETGRRASMYSISLAFMVWNPELCCDATNVRVC